jgi:hypothetical protein
MYMRTTIEVVNHYRQYYQYQYASEKQPNSLVNIVGEPRVWITIAENIVIETNIARTNILAATIRKYPRSIRQSKIWRITPR